MGSSNSTQSQSNKTDNKTDKKTQVPDKWDATHIPSLKNKVAIVTGANSGIGYVTARELARNGAHVVLACRSEQRGREAEAKLTSELAASVDASGATGAAVGNVGNVGNVGSVTFAKLDVSSLESVKRFADDFKRTHDRLDLLVNNAGIMAVPFALTVDGIESQFATNHLGHFALTAQLFELLKASAPSRVVNVSSLAHKDSVLDEDEIVALSKDKYVAYPVYCDTKLCNILFTEELDRRIRSGGLDGVIVMACHPGATSTNLIAAPATESGLLESLQWRFFAFISPYVFPSAQMGALPTLFAATAPNVQSGDFFGVGGLFKMVGYPAIDEPTKQIEFASAAKKLWTLSESLADLSFGVGMKQS